jgi:hypothetical protein
MQNYMNPVPSHVLKLHNLFISFYKQDLYGQGLRSAGHLPIRRHQGQIPSGGKSKMQGIQALQRHAPQYRSSVLFWMTVSLMGPPLIRIVARKSFKLDSFRLLTVQGTSRATAFPRRMITISFPSST